MILEVNILSHLFSRIALTGQYYASSTNTFRAISHYMSLLIDLHLVQDRLRFDCA